MHLTSSPGTNILSVDDRMINAMRLILAFLALVIIYLDPSEPSRLVTLTYCAFILYTLYSAVIYFLSVLRPASFIQSIEAWLHWADIVWYTLLISLSHGTNSLFFFFYFFSTLVVSFRRGFKAGLQVTVAAAALFSAVGYLAAPGGDEFELNRFLLRPTYLLILGYMMAYWGGQEMTLKRRLALLHEISPLSNPRFGVDRTIAMTMNRLRAFYDAESCVLVMADLEAGEYELRKVARNSPDAAGLRAEKITPATARQLLGTPPAWAFSFGNLRGVLLPSDHSFYAYDVKKRAYTREQSREAEAAASLLDAESLVSAPLFYQNQFIGRVFIIARRKRTFEHSDPLFLSQVLGQVMPAIENIRLVDRLASDAAEEERQRMARNIHDSVIQPYLGLQIGLTTVRQRLAASVSGANEDATQMIETASSMVGRIDQLIEMTNSGIIDLRRYVGGLKGGHDQENSLLASVRRFAKKFSDATGIVVWVEAEGTLTISDRLAADVFQMAAEGLSNVRRHVRARSALIRLQCIGDKLTLRIENDDAEGTSPESFTPRSISGRAEALGGKIQIEPRADGGSIVTVSIPL